MQILNISPSPITLAGSYTIAANAQVDVPFASLLDDMSFVSYVDSNQLRIISAEESITTRMLPRFTQGTWVPSQAVGAGVTLVPKVGTTSNPVLLWVAPFQFVRIYLNVSQGDMTVTLTDSPDGGTTFYPIENVPTLSATYTTAGTGLASILLPAGLCLLQPSLSSTNGGTATVFYARQSAN